MQNRNYSRYRVFHLKVNEIKPIFGYVLMNFEIPGINNALLLVPVACFALLVSTSLRAVWAEER